MLETFALSFLKGFLGALALFVGLAVGFAPFLFVRWIKRRKA